MITLNLNTDGKRLKFTYAVANVDPDYIKGKFVMEFGDSNVSFPAKISDNLIIVELKTNNLFLRNSAGKVIKSKLEIVAGPDTFITPWHGEVKIIRGKAGKKVIKKDDLPVVKRPPKVKKSFMSPLEEKMESIKEKLAMNENKNIPELDENENPELQNFLNTPIEEIIYTEEELSERKEKKEQLSGILDIPMGELVKQLEEK